jgi:alpha-galactosidase
MNRDRFRGIVLAGVVLASFAAGVATTAAHAADAADMRSNEQWVRRHLLLAEVTPFSFVYDGQSSRSLLRTWTRADETEVLEDKDIQRTTTWSDPKTGLEVRCVSIEHSDFPVVEWTLRFRNPGKKETPIIADIQPLDVQIEKPPGADFVLHGCKGDSCTPDSFQPYAIRLGPGESRSYAPPGGRPTEGVFPYYNLATSDGGLILAIGWPGQWKATFRRGADDAMDVVAGQEQTRFKLLPGERVGSPLVTLLFWKDGDWIDGQNVWRRWMVAHNLPRPA